MCVVHTQFIAFRANFIRKKKSLSPLRLFHTTVLWKEFCVVGDFVCSSYTWSPRKRFQADNKRCSVHTSTGNRLNTYSNSIPIRDQCNASWKLRGKVLIYTQSLLPPAMLHLLFMRHCVAFVVPSTHTVTQTASFDILPARRPRWPDKTTSRANFFNACRTDDFSAESARPIWISWIVAENVCVFCVFGQTNSKFICNDRVLCYFWPGIKLWTINIIRCVGLLMARNSWTMDLQGHKVNLSYAPTWAIIAHELVGWCDRLHLLHVPISRSVIHCWLVAVAVAVQTNLRGQQHNTQICLVSDIWLMPPAHGTGARAAGR